MTLAYALDGKPIPREHGAPLRIIMPYLYAWKGANFLNRIGFTHAQTRAASGEIAATHNHTDPWREERFS